MKRIIILLAAVMIGVLMIVIVIKNKASKNEGITPETIEHYRAIALVKNGDAEGIDEVKIEINDGEYQNGYRLIKYRNATYYCDVDDFATYKKLKP